MSVLNLSGYGSSSRVLAFSMDRYEVHSEKGALDLMPLSRGVCPNEVYSKIKDRRRKISILYVLRDDLCTWFLQNPHRLFHMGVGQIICYDNAHQLLRYNRRVVIERKLNHYSDPSKPILQFPSHHTPSHDQLYLGVSITDRVREKLEQYEGIPSWIFALDIINEFELGVPAHSVARAIREVRNQEAMEGLPLLHELVMWLIDQSKNAGMNLNFNKLRSYELLQAMCRHVLGERHNSPAVSYLNITNLKKVVSYIEDRSQGGESSVAQLQ